MGNKPSLLNETKVSDVVAAQKVVKIPHNATIGESLKILADNNISSAPLEGEGEYSRDQGVVGLKDILSFLFTHEGADTWTREAHGDQLQAFFGEPVALAFNAAKSVFVSIDASLHDACDIMLSTSVYRLCVSSGGSITHLLTQSDLVRFFAQHLDKLHHTPDATLTQLLQDLQGEALTLGTAPVKTVSSDCPSGQALKLLSDSKVSSLAVTTAAGSLVAPLAASAVKGLRATNWPSFVASAGTFVLRGGATVKPCRIQESDTLRDMLSKMLASQAHRVFVVDNGDKPIRVITLTDLVALMMAETDRPA